MNVINNNEELVQIRIISTWRNSLELENFQIPRKLVGGEPRDTSLLF